MKTTVCTLFEGHYHFGVGALANSLHAAGYRGVVWAGYRGELPPWAADATPIDAGYHRFQGRDDVVIHFVRIDTPVHFAYHKPDFLKCVLDEYASDADAAIYIDPDIVVKCPWTLLDHWPRDGVALVHDVHSLMPPRHPMRLAWREILTARGMSADFPRDRYYNSGFVGVARSQQHFLTTWRDVIDIVIEIIGHGKGFKHGPASDLFHSTDQDALNIALMACDAPVNAAHSEAMDFATGGYLLSHSIGSPKPWQGGFIRNALRGFPPSLPIKEYLRHTQYPIQSLDPLELARLQFSLKLGAIIGRFYRRA